MHGEISLYIWVEKPGGDNYATLIHYWLQRSHLSIRVHLVL